MRELWGVLKREKTETIRLVDERYIEGKRRRERQMLLYVIMVDTKIASVS